MAVFSSFAFQQMFLTFTQKKKTILIWLYGIMHVTRIEDAFKTTHYLLYVCVYEQLYLTVLCVGELLNSNMTIKTSPTVILNKKKKYLWENSNSIFRHEPEDDMSNAREEEKKKRNLPWISVFVVCALL